VEEVTTTETEAEVVVEETAQEASAETETTETEEQPEEPRIPKGRFDEVIGQRNELRRQIEEMQTERDTAVKAEEAKPQQEKTVEPPDDLDTQGKVKWYVEKYSSEMLQRETGLTLNEIKSALSATRETSQDLATRKWEQMCADHGLRPDSEDIQEHVAGMIQLKGKDAIPAIMKATKGIFTQSKYRVKGNGDTEKPTANVEQDGVTGVMAKDGVTFRNAKDATEAAKKGIKAEHESLEDIIAARGSQG